MGLIDKLREERKIALDFWRQAKKQKTSPDYFKGKIDALTLCIHQIESEGADTSEREQANDNIPLVIKSVCPDCGKPKRQEQYRCDKCAQKTY